MGGSEAAADASMESDAVVIKAAKKALKREESGSMKIKDLAKSLLEKLDNTTSGSYDKNAVRRCIEGSDSFVVDGKFVALKKKGGGGGDDGESKKRKSSSAEEGGGESVGDGGVATTSADRKAAKKAAKRAKKERKDADEPTTVATATAGASSGDNSSIQAWRTQHKIVLRDSRSGEEGVAATKAISTNEEYHPYQTFDAPGCQERILGELIRQCTVANKFTRPSPIQAQCWPVLLSCDPRTGRHRDAVGIAETGSGKEIAASHDMKRR
jgi:hypothetical protein